MLPIFQVIRFPVSIMYLFYHEKKSRRFFIFDIFRMMAAQVQIEMVLAIQGKLQLNPNYYIGQKVMSHGVFFSEECSSKGGTQDGSCASGFGVCCVCMQLNTLYLLLIT